MDDNKTKLFIGITAPPSVDLLNGQLNYLSKQGFEVSLLAPQHERVKDFCEKEGVRHILVEIERNISLINDLFTLLNLFRIFREEKPDIVNLGTPKMSFLGMIAAALAGINIRIYTCRGFRFEHEKGLFKKFLIFLEKITSKLSHRIYSISKSLGKLGVEKNIFKDHKVIYIGEGSSNGIDLNLFDPSNVNSSAKQIFKKKHNLENKFVYGYVGRIIDRKGIKELYESFNIINERYRHTRLLMVGRPFWDQVSDNELINKYKNHEGIIMTGYQPKNLVPTFLSMMDNFVLPAWWEGFGNVLIEAAAMGIPVVSTKVTGCVDAVSDGYNGILVEPHSISELINAMQKICVNEELRKELGTNGLKWASNFEPEIVWKGQEALYRKLLNM